MANYSFQDPDLPDGSVIDGGNFTQAEPGTEIMVGKTLVINGGNFCNVKKQPEWTINGGNFTQKSFCTNKLQNWPKPLCIVECEHMVSKEDVIIDGVLIDTIYTYEHGRP